MEVNGPSIAPQGVVYLPELKGAQGHHHELDGREMPVEVAGENNHVVELDARR